MKEILDEPYKEEKPKEYPQFSPKSLLLPLIGIVFSVLGPLLVIFLFILITYLFS